jgi:hypothetical protein
VRYRWLGSALLVLAGACAAGCGGGSSAASGGPTTSVTPVGSTTPTPTPTPSPTGPNGIASLAPTVALSKVSAAAAGQTSVHITGTVAQGKDTLGLDVQAGLSSGQGTLHLGGGRVTLRLTNGTIYLNGDVKGLIGLGFPKATATATANQWIGAQAAATSLSALLNFTDLVKSIVTPNGKVVAGRTTTVNGISVYTLVDKTKNGGTLYIATTGEPLPVQVVNAKPREKLSFSQWGAPISVTVPPKVIPVPSSVTSAAP